MEKLYEDIGKKIKRAAYWTFIVEAVIAALEGIAIPIVLISNLDDVIFALFVGLLLGAIVAALGVLIAWVSSWLLYGFGELIDKTCDIEKNTRNGQSKMQIDENISTAEAEAAKNVAKRKAKETEESAKKILAKQRIQSNEDVKYKLSNALNFQTDDGMISYLKRIDNEDVKKILEAPPAQIRSLIKHYLSKSE